MSTSVQFYKIIYRNNQVSFIDLKKRAPSFDEAIQNVDKYLDGDRENIFLTVAECFNEPKPNKKGDLVDRYMSVQKIIFFDIDGIDVNKKMETLVVLRKALNLPERIGYAVFSGHGLQIHIGLKTPITDVDFFEKNRGYYKIIAETINDALEEADLKGHCDTSVFKNTQVARVPGTLNVKPNKQPVEAIYLNGSLEPYEFNLKDVAGVPAIEETEFVTKKGYEVLKKTIDVAGVLEGCEAIKFAYANPAKVDEPFWYRLLGAVSFLPDGKRHAHEISKGHPSYTREETDRKYDQVVASQTGPVLCKTINTCYGKCSECPFFEKVKTPLQIKRENHIGTEPLGFREFIIDENGALKKNRPVNNDDLLKAFKREHAYTNVFGEQLYLWNGSHWERSNEAYPKTFAERNVKDPAPKEAERCEFRAKVFVNNYVDSHWLDHENTFGFVNFKNGVLATRKAELKDHNRMLPFLYTLPYEFKEGSTVLFDKFLDETLQTEDEKEFLWRYIGSCFDMSAAHQKALFLLGPPATGKSTLLNVLRAIFPSVVASNFSSVDMMSGAFRFAARTLHGKLINLSDEAFGTRSFIPNIVKNCISNGLLTYEEKGSNKTFDFKCYAKFIFATNNMPRIEEDDMYNFERKFEVIRFERIVPVEKRDIGLENKLKDELEGIAYKALQKAKKGIEAFEKSRFYDLGITETITQVKAERIIENDEHERFLMRIKTDAEGQMTLDDIYQEYKEHCRASNVNANRKSVFTKMFGRYRTKNKIVTSQPHGQKRLYHVKIIDTDIE